MIHSPLALLSIKPILPMKHLNLLVFSMMVILVVALPFIQCTTQKQTRENPDDSGVSSTWNASITDNANEMLEKGKAVFRFETFGDDVFWTDQLQLHQAIADSKHGGIGEGL